MVKKGVSQRPWTFYILAAFFALFILFLYGPMFSVYILSFQGPDGGLTFPMKSISLHWFSSLFEQQRTGDFSGSFFRSMALALMVMVLTTVISVSAGMGFRREFRGSRALFYIVIASLIMPGVLISLGIGLLFHLFGIEATWYTSALGAQLTWTLPFGLLIMFAALSRFERNVEEAARDLGATNWQTLRYIVLPLLLPGIIGVALFGFTLSYDELPRTTLAVGAHNTLPMEIMAMTTTVTSPSLYALGTLTTGISFLAIVIAFTVILRIRRRRLGKGLS